MNLNLEGKRGLVTGAAKGIGRAIALEMAREGMDLVLFDMCGDCLTDTAAAIAEETGRTVVPVTVDITHAEALKGAYASIAGDGLYALVNNAGISRDSLLIRAKDADIDSVLNVNLAAAMKVARLAVPTLLKSNAGRIVNLSSVIGLHGNYGQTSYAASKAGIIGFTKSLAKEIASRGITVNAIAPGYIKTEMTEALPDKIREALVAQIPMGYGADPWDVAQTVTFLLSDRARYITGEVVRVDGGFGM